MNLSVIRAMLLAVTTLICITASSLAALNVIADLGGQPTAPLFDAINNENNEFTPPRSLNPPVPPSRADISGMLPVTTPEMSAGKVEPRALSLASMTPVFLVGDVTL